MARRRIGFDTRALEQYAERLEAVGGSDALKRATQSGMAAAKAETNKNIKAAMQAGNLPAKGAYSHGDTIGSLDENFTVKWTGNKAELAVGFAINNGGLASVFLMHGTPRMSPANGLWDAIYGPTAKRIEKKEMRKAVKKVLERLGG